MSDALPKLRLLLRVCRAISRVLGPRPLEAFRAVYREARALEFAPEEATTIAWTTVQWCIQRHLLENSPEEVR